MQTTTKPIRLPLGRIVATPGALRRLADRGIAPHRLLARHQRGDWGDTCPDDCVLNDRAARLGGERVLSSYKLEGAKFWIITEADRSATTILLPEEY